MKELIEVEKQQNNFKKRSKYWDIVKAIAIISIVIGHTAYHNLNIIKFVYCYHLVIFYFVSSYFYNEEKYGNNPMAYFTKVLKDNWKKTIFYAIIVILLHNVLLKYNFYPIIEKKYNIDNFIYFVLNSLTFAIYNPYLAAFWFIPTLIAASGIFSGIVYLSRKISECISNKIKNVKSDEEIIKYLFIILQSLLIGTLGVYLNLKYIDLDYNLETALLVIPICALGYLFKKYKGKMKKFNNIFVAMVCIIICGVFIWYQTNINNFEIELSKNQVIGFNMFYIISIIGIIFCLSLAKVIEKIPVVNKVMGTVGKYTFSIMALHFIFIKLVDVIYAYSINETNPDVISSFPCAYPNELFSIYILVGTFMPMLIGMLLNKIKNIKSMTKKV